MSGWFGGKTDAKADEAAKTGPSVQDRAIEAKDQTISFIGEKSEAVTKAASDTADAAMKMGSDAMGKASETGQAITDRAIESKDQTFGFFGEKTEAAKKMAADTGDAAKQKSAEAAKCVEENAAKFTGEPAAPKEPTGNMFQQAGGQVMGAATGARDAVMNTLGMGGDKADVGSAK
ncbi:hypothetical protein CFC21_068858 [Triticum aestivum]|uniref:Cold acclimation protein WCOR615 n=4 Tax=Triticum TaxID=4564 RepID=A0A9R1HB53_WHEAT|nr:ABA-inducible protein PHV A1-like [Triticum dicoccoides]XP_044383955.1 ABA-inducible protein PHV A1 [Triticum aestivum]XP_048532674.1 ABA-inducible protein PHV A1-like [Triticum urartu]VAI24857.1 unnamed protein product [Triticum turgidum subsp. durum]AAB18208.1 cold acclimation protein WCOR615 [Triticum aestivum]EMS61758.1 hypothetical protein TRIUR3_22815 [Triticum urartu]KAF7062233.1 hypothetical protein CFC21_068858 [Triticum aestivum]